MALDHQVMKGFPFLFQEKDFAFVDDVDANNRSVVVAESRDLRIRFISDRSDFFVDVGNVSAPRVWIPLYDVLDKMKSAGEIAGDYKYANKIGPLSNVLKRHLPAVIAYVNRV